MDSVSGAPELFLDDVRYSGKLFLPRPASLPVRRCLSLWLMKRRTRSFSLRHPLSLSALRAVSSIPSPLQLEIAVFCGKAALWASVTTARRLVWNCAPSLSSQSFPFSKVNSIAGRYGVPGSWAFRRREHAPVSHLSHSPKQVMAMALPFSGRILVLREAEVCDKAALLILHSCETLLMLTAAGIFPPGTVMIVPFHKLEGAVCEGAAPWQDRWAESPVPDDLWPDSRR